MTVFARSGTLQRSFAADASYFRTPTRKLAAVVALGATLALPAFFSPTNLAIADVAWITIIAAISLNLLTGYAGQVSLGQAAFLAIGAYSAVFALRTFHVGMLVGIPLAGFVSAAVGLVIGIPSLRFRGFYLALTTLGLQFIATYVLTQYQVSAGGLQGFTIPIQSLGPLALDNDLTWYYFLAAFGLLTLLFAANLVRTRTGRAWMAVRDRDIAASIIGVDVTRYKLLAFTVTAFIAGIAGALGAYYRGNVSIDSYDLSLAIIYIAMIIVGGLGSNAGSVIGAVILTWLPYWISNVVQALPPEWPMVNSLQLGIFAVQSAVFGVVIMVFLLFEPRGLIAIWKRVKAWALLWPYQRAEISEGLG